MQRLLTPITVGDLSLPNRIIMAPLTRCRADPVTRVPTPVMAEYYAQRATAGLILSEATSVEPMGVGYPRTPGIWSQDQVQGWKKITKAIHEKGGRIFMQLWHVGRSSHPSYLNGKLPIAPSALAIQGHVSLLRPEQPYPVPRSLELDEIPNIVEAFRMGAVNAKEAGFDGVELHGANGYLIDEFLQDSANKRTDEYGGSIPNRAKLMLEVVDSLISVWGPNRVGVHLAPRGDLYSMGDTDPLATFSYVAEQLGKRNIAFICTRESLKDDSISHILREKFGGLLISNENMTPESGENLLAEDKADAIAYGQLYIANPDLVERIRHNLPLNKPNPKTFYSDGIEGYIDYPFHESNTEFRKLSTILSV